MGLSDTPPNWTGPARTYVRLLQNLDLVNPNPGTAPILTTLLGTFSNYFFYNNVNYPCTIARATNADTIIVWISGVRVAGAIGQLVAQYINPINPMSATRVNNRVQEWASEGLSITGALTAPLLRPKVILVGHSLGGAIAFTMARQIRVVNPGAQIWVCSFGTPKVCGLSDLVSNGANLIARWTNPQDNVPRLPPVSTSAPVLYGALTHYQRTTLQQWRHPCQQFSVGPTGSLAVSDGVESSTITVATLVALLQSPQGVFGTGHGLETYYNYLLAATSTYQEPSIPPVLGGPGTVPPPAAPPIVFSPPALPPPVNNVAVQASFVAFREAAVINEAIPVTVPMPNLPTVSKNNGVWSFDWMGYQVAVAPSKRKAQALSRHMRRFLRLYQGVGQSQSHEFVYALAAYLVEAADPASDFKPILNDGGNPPLIPLAGG